MNTIKAVIFAFITLLTVSDAFAAGQCYTDVRHNDDGTHPGTSSGPCSRDNVCTSTIGIGPQYISSPQASGSSVMASWLSKGDSNFFNQEAYMFYCGDANDSPPIYFYTTNRDNIIDAATVDSVSTMSIRLNFTGGSGITSTPVVAADCDGHSCGNRFYYVYASGVPTNLIATLTIPPGAKAWSNPGVIGYAYVYTDLHSSSGDPSPTGTNDAWTTISLSGDIIPPTACSLVGGNATITLDPLTPYQFQDVPSGGLVGSTKISSIEFTCNNDTDYTLKLSGTSDPASTTHIKTTNKDVSIAVLNGSNQVDVNGGVISGTTNANQTISVPVGYSAVSHGVAPASGNFSATATYVLTTP